MSASAEPPPHRDRRSAADGEQAQAGSVRSFRSAGDEPVRRRSDRGAHVRERRCRLRSALTRRTPAQDPPVRERAALAGGARWPTRPRSRLATAGHARTDDWVPASPSPMHAPAEPFRERRGTGRW